MQSPDNTVITQANQSIVDAYGTSWSIIGGQVAANGLVDATTNGVTRLAYENGKIWQENTKMLWWSKGKLSDTWGPPGGTSLSPVQDLSRTWFGGDGTFATAADWTGNTVPQAGSTAVIGQGTVTLNTADGNGVNVSFQSIPGQGASAQGPVLKFNGAGPYSIGTVQTLVNAEIRIDASLSGVIPDLTLAGIRDSGSQLSVLEYQGHAVVVKGDSSLASGAVLSVRGFNGGQAPHSHFENDGVMMVDASTASLGELTGQGVVRVTGNGNVVLNSASAGETIRLESGHLDISSYRSQAFLAPITNFGANSSITLRDAQVTASSNPREVFVMSSPTAGELFIYEGTSVHGHLFISGQSHIYASLPTGSGSVLLTAYDTGHSLPIARA